MLGSLYTIYHRHFLFRMDTKTIIFAFSKFVLFNAVLPAVDIGTDFITFFTLQSAGHPKWAVLTLFWMFVPFIVRLGVLVCKWGVGYCCPGRKDTVGAILFGKKPSKDSGFCVDLLLPVSYTHLTLPTKA